jgi:hypothetical protein
VYVREGTTSRVMAADRPYGEFYDFYSVSPEYFGSFLVVSATTFCTSFRLSALNASHSARKLSFGFELKTVMKYLI